MISRRKPTINPDTAFSPVAGVSLEQFLGELGHRFDFSEERPAYIDRTYLDSFDWRLFEGGGTLCFERESHARRLVWTPHDSRQGRVMLGRVNKPPRFGWDYPPGAMRSTIGPLLEMRALLPRIDLVTRVRTLRLLDDERKTVVRLRVEESRPRRAERDDDELNQEQPPVAVRIVTLPVRGYDDELADLRKWLYDSDRVTPRTPCLLEEAINATGGRVADYSSKLDFEFDPDMPAAEAVREIHRFLLGVMEQNLFGVREDIDSEFLHDFRVAIRRTRSALTQVKGVLPASATDHFKERFAWLGQVTGPTRDMHVYLLGFDDYRDSLPRQYQGDLEPLRAFLIAHQKLEHGQLVERLASPEFEELIRQWRDFLARTDLGARSKHGDKPLIEVASKRIREMAQRVFEEGDAIDDRSPPEDLHELRKSCKKLRYLMEFFQSIYPANKIGGPIREIKRLLDNLGDYQDLEVQAGKLRHFAHQMVEEGATPADTLLAMGMLVDGLLRRQQQKRGEFSERYARFADTENRQRFQALFGNRGGK